MGRVGVGCDTWMKNIGMDEDMCIPRNASWRMGIIGISLGTGMGAKFNNGCQSIHPHKLA
jgi:hypothetical protein